MGRDLRVAIVGGGLGGLAAANALTSVGVHVDVYEQAPELGEVGAGIQLAPNGARHLYRWGLWDDITRVGAPLGEGSQYHRYDGTPVAPVVTTDSSGWNALLGMHRADFIDVLARHLPSGTVHTNHKCVGFEQDKKTGRVFFENGATAEADVVLGTDGIHSTLQRAVVPPSQPVFSGSIAYRGLVEHERVPDWPTDRFMLWMGDSKHVLVYPVRNGTLINYVGFVPTDDQKRESWSAPGDPDALRAAFTGWDPMVEALFAEVEQCFWWGLYDREPLPRWTEGRLTLVGDAAHPMLPHLGQGVSQAIEDAATLAVLLDGTDAEQAPQALQAYERIRRERTGAVQQGARNNGLRYGSSYDDLEVRDADLARTAELRRWIYDHDAATAAQEFAG